MVRLHSLHGDRAGVGLRHHRNWLQVFRAGVAVWLFNWPVWDPSVPALWLGLRNFIFLYWQFYHCIPLWWSFLHTELRKPFAILRGINFTNIYKVPTRCRLRSRCFGSVNEQHRQCSQFSWCWLWCWEGEVGGSASYGGVMTFRFHSQDVHWRLCVEGTLLLLDAHTEPCLLQHHPWCWSQSSVCPGNWALSLCTCPGGSGWLAPRLHCDKCIICL